MVGIDEVGRGPWAGPIAAAAVALDSQALTGKIKDSKQQNHSQRAKALGQIKTVAVSIGIGWVSPAVIDREGLNAANRLAMQLAYKQISCEHTQLIIDGRIDFINNNYSSAEVRADQKYQCVAAASIVAKVARDNYMALMARVYPKYGFDKHVGYGTKLHQRSLLNYGASPLHRLSFAPVAATL